MNTFRIVLSHRDVEGQLLGLYPFLTFPPGCCGPWAHPSLRSACVQLDLASGPSDGFAHHPCPKVGRSSQHRVQATFLQRPLTSVYGWFQETLLKNVKARVENFLGISSPEEMSFRR